MITPGFPSGQRGVDDELGDSSSACVEMMAECFADHFRDGDALGFGSTYEQVLEFWIEADRFDAGWSLTEPGASPSAALGDDLIDIEALLRLFGELGCRGAGDGGTGFGVVVDGFGHRSRSFW